MRKLATESTSPRYLADEYSSVYKKFTVSRKATAMHIGRAERVLAIDGEYVYMMPPPESKNLFDSVRTVRCKGVRMCVCVRVCGWLAGWLTCASLFLKRSLHRSLAAPLTRCFSHSLHPTLFHPPTAPHFLTLPRKDLLPHEFGTVVPADAQEAEHQFPLGGPAEQGRENVRAGCEYGPGSG